MKATIVVTGANDGIGYHLTRALLDAGYGVAALDVADHHLGALTASYPDLLLVSRCDVSSTSQVEEAVRTVVARWGRIDVLVNNACLALFDRFEEKETEDLHREFEVNFFGYVNTIKAVLPYMKAQGGGIIHNVSSGVGITGFPGLTGYAATKGAVEALTRTLALELAPYGICVNLMHPPLTNTRSASPLGIPPQAMESPERVGQRLAERILSTRPVVTPDFRTAAYLFLAYRYPHTLGKLFATLTERSRKQVA